MAVYTDVTDQALDAFLADYEIGSALSLKGIAEGVENSNYLLHTETGLYILTLYEKRVAEKDLPFFLELMEHLADHDFPCPLPIHGRDGKALRQLAGRPAAIISFLDGVWAHHPEQGHCAQLGAAAANMHLACQSFPMRRKNSLTVGDWRPLFETFANRADEIEEGLGQLIATELDVLEASWPRNLPTGVIHADLFPDNVFFLKGKFSGFIDFYFACTDMLAYELAICLNAWCFDQAHKFDAGKAKAFLKAYQTKRTLSADEIEALPLLARGAALRFLLTRTHDMIFHDEGALVTPKDPREYAAKLRFHQSVSSPGAYGLII